jgi:hypothetical protein
MTVELLKSRMLAMGFMAVVEVLLVLGLVETRWIGWGTGNALRMCLSLCEMTKTMHLT